MLKTGAFRGVTFVVLLLLFGGATAVADSSGTASLRDWFAQSKSHAVYLPVEGELASIFREADVLSLPASLLIERMNLGAARALPPETLVRGMRQELVRLRTAAEVISRCERSPRGRTLLETTSRANLLNTISIYLSGGLSADLMVSFLDAAAQSRHDVDAAFRVCEVLLTVSLSGDFSEAELLRLGAALIDSALSPAGYAAVGSFIVRASAAGRGGSSLLRSVEQILHQGGGLPQMELELGRRR